MAYTNSPLVTYKQLSPNYSKRTKPITKITIHHMAGKLSLQQCGNIFANPKRQGSSNYGIDNAGKIGMYVEEKNRAWTSGNADNDQSAVTIECANSTLAPNWEVSAACYKALINLCVDICKRNGIKALSWTGNKYGTLTCHYMFQSTACPGPYLKNRMGAIATEVNRILGEVPTPVITPSSYVFEKVDYSPVFDANFYYNNYADLRNAVGTDSKKLFQHFTTYGMKEGRKACATFDVNIYKSRYKDLQDAYGNNLPMYYKHYCLFGKNEGRTGI